MNVLITGAHGFLGQYLCKSFNSDFVTTLGFHANNDIVCDIATDDFILPNNLELVIHAAGIAHCVDEKKIAKRIYQVNCDGTKRLCKALEKYGIPKYFVFVSSTSVYGKIAGEDIDETSSTNANRPYSISKLQAEEFLTQWCKANNVVLTIVRPALIVGSNPKGNFAIMLKAIRGGYYMNIGKSNGKRSMVLASDVCEAIKLAYPKGGLYNLADDDNPSIAAVSHAIANAIGRKHNIPTIPSWVVKPVAYIGTYVPVFRYVMNIHKYQKLTCSLTFSNKKAKTCLGWTPRNTVEYLQNLK